MKIPRKITLTIKRNTNWFVVHCRELGVTSQGKTLASECKNIAEAMELYLEDEDVQKMLEARDISKTHNIQKHY